MHGAGAFLSQGDAPSTRRQQGAKDIGFTEAQKLVLGVPIPLRPFPGKLSSFSSSSSSLLLPFFSSSVGGFEGCNKSSLNFF